MIKIINLVGINDENKIIVEHNKGIVSQLSFRIEGNNGLLYQLDNPEYDISMLLIGGEKFTLQLTFPNSSVLFNSIGFVEGNSKALHQLSKILDQISNPIINHPKSVLLTARDRIGSVLSGIEGIIIPECLKITPRSFHDVTMCMEEKRLTFPFLFRPLMAHGSHTLIRIDSVNEMEKLYRFAFDGENTFYMSSFFDFRSEDGLYRKMRFMVIGDEVIPRHLILSSSWQIHTQDNKMESTFKKQQIEEETAFLESIEISVGKKLMGIKKRLGLDYFGVDCAIGSKDEIVIFEINPFSMFGTGKVDTYHDNVITHAKGTLQRLIELKSSELN